MKKILMISLLLTSIIYANEYTVFYPEDFRVGECYTKDVYEVGCPQMDIVCLGIQDSKYVEYKERIEMIPAPFKINYVKGGIKNGIKFDD